MNAAELLTRAREAMENAYAPYSNFKVGAALLCASGRVYTGCNVENASYGATNCAERTAIFKAVSEGEREFLAIAIASSSHKATPPCGICRQVMTEFNPELRLILEGENGVAREISLSEIFPLPTFPLNG